jgi:hypothetical protein
MSNTSINIGFSPATSTLNSARRAKKASMAVMVAGIATATVLSAGRGYGAISTITSISTSMTTGSSLMVPNLPGVGASYSQFQSPNKFNVTYAGNDEKLLTVTANGVTYSASGMANAVVERGSSSDNTDNLWEDGTNSGSSIALQGPEESSLVGAFAANNLLVGADNIFANQGNAVGNNTNIDRLDMLYTSGFKASSSQAFAIFDRGPTTDHDAFQIAAITSISNTGVPTNYGPLISLADGTWGTTDLTPTQEQVILRKNNSAGSSAPFDPSDSTAQTLGGVLIPTSNLVAAGTTIYGYSLFGADVTGTGTELTEYTNTTYFPYETATSTTGGLDPSATTSILFTTAVPEPTTISLAMLAGAGLLGRRTRKQKIAATTAA